MKKVFCIVSFVFIFHSIYGQSAAIDSLQEVEWRDKDGKTKLIYCGTLMKNFNDFYST